MALFGRQATIGLDIGRSSIIGVQVAGKDSAPCLKAYHERPLPEGLVFEGEVLDAEGLGAEIKAFMRDSGMRGRVVHLGVGNQKVVVRNIDVPEMAEDELRGAIEFQAQDYIPIPVTDAVLDFQVLGRAADEDGLTRQQVLLVAAQRDMIKGYLDASRKAGVRVAGIDVSAFALLRAVSPEVSFIDQGTDPLGAFAVADISSSVSTLVVAREGTPLFTRIVNFSWDNFTQALVERQGILPEDALALAEQIGVNGPLSPDVNLYTGPTIVEAQGTLGRVAEALSEEIHRSLDYFHSQEYSTPVDRLVLTGQGALLRNLDAYLSESLGIPVLVGNPLLKLSRNASGKPDALLAAIAPRMAVAVGLALDEVA